MDKPQDAHPTQPVILPVRGLYPRFGADNWLAPNCTVVGDVETGADCSIWFGAVVRGDVCAIRIGTRVNIQDGAVLHGTWEKTSLTIGDEASIGHNAIVHGCTVESGALIGMGASVDAVDVNHRTALHRAVSTILTDNTRNTY